MHFEFFKAGISIGDGEEEVEDIRIELDPRQHGGKSLGVQVGLGCYEVRQLLEGEAVHRHILTLVVHGKLRGGKELGLGLDG